MRIARPQRKVHVRYVGHDVAEAVESIDASSCLKSGQFAQLTQKWTHQRNDFKQYVHEAATGLPVDT
ncbi:hypothetical protein L914_00451 [Phytophthora nicotianae]|uniref:Uncharacterized protein n=1 Tax=Phytophthora nicotianae TaxID=4792 RepID=W2P712_PHYNI|nr:hypothetical protein L914_00451 [Phytophthora nicotianae]